MSKKSRRTILQRDPYGRELATFVEEENEDSILRDGQSLRVPLYLRDGVTPNPETHAGAGRRRRDQGASTTTAPDVRRPATA